MVWGRGGEWSIVGAPPLPPDSCVFFFLPFGLKFQSGPVDTGLQTRAWWGIPALHLHTLTHFFFFFGFKNPLYHPVPD